MDYPEFNAISILAMVVSIFVTVTVYMFVRNISERLVRLEKKVVEFIKSFWLHVEARNKSIR